jgi:hypothetical protein
VRPAAHAVAHGAVEAPARQQADPVAQTFFELLTALHQDEYTGIVVLHLCAGVPKVAEIPEKVIDRRQVRLR